MGSIGEAEEVWEALEQVYMAAADKAELPIRVFAMVPLATWYCLAPICFFLASSTEQHVIKPLSDPGTLAMISMYSCKVCTVDSSLWLG